MLERAHGGTLLLDEVSDMPLETQGKIVRALQDQTFERLGGSARVKVDVRVLSTTNRDLQAEIAAGRFREDLYYRLAVVPVRVPALRERREDVPVLALHFIARSAESSGIPVRALSADTLAALQAYDWPGNVRQLRNLMDWLLIMAPGSCRRSNPRGHAAAGDRVARAGVAEHRSDRRHHVAAAAGGAGSVRDTVSACPVAAVRRQHLPHRAVRRDGAVGVAPQAEAAWGEFGRARRGLGALPLNWIVSFAAVVLLVVVLQDAFEVMLLPRRVYRRVRLTRFYFASAWTSWCWLAKRMPPGMRRERFLSVFGALSMVVLFGLWASALILAFGLLEWALQASRPRRSANRST